MNIYESRGVSTDKSDVQAATANLDQGLYPGAFCKIVPDFLTSDPNYCLVMHSDGAGTKAALAYIAWKEGLMSIQEAWEGINQDSLIMNFDDVGCVGALGPFIINSTINRNKFLIPGEVIAAIITGCQKVADFFTTMGIPCVFAGGETADVGDLVRTITVDNTIVCRLPRNRIIDASRMAPGDVIVGFSSTGMACWESELNSGIGSNGFTNGRHDMLQHSYAKKYPETFSPEIKSNLVYRGKFLLSDTLPDDERFTIASALLSPTRTYLPLIKEIIKIVPFREIHGLIHCSAGGQTKIKKFGQPGNVYVKDNLFSPKALFRTLKDASGLTWQEMYHVYNMGHRLEAVVPQIYADACIYAAQGLDIEAKVIGHVEAGAGSKRKVIIRSEFGEFVY